jgi:hypothetical protein
MKNILNLLEFKLGKDSADFKFCKKEIMNYFYGALKNHFDTLTKKGIITKCECKNNLRQGYASCPKCGGCGFIDK